MACTLKFYRLTGLAVAASILMSVCKCNTSSSPPTATNTKSSNGHQPATAPVANADATEPSPQDILLVYERAGGEAGMPLEAIVIGTRPEQVSLALQNMGFRPNIRGYLAPKAEVGEFVSSLANAGLWKIESEPVPQMQDSFYSLLTVEIPNRKREIIRYSSPLPEELMKRVRSFAEQRCQPMMNATKP